MVALEQNTAFRVKASGRETLGDSEPWSEAGEQGGSRRFCLGTGGAGEVLRARGGDVVGGGFPSTSLGQAPAFCHTWFSWEQPGSCRGAEQRSKRGT